MTTGNDRAATQEKHEDMFSTESGGDNLNKATATRPARKKASKLPKLLQTEVVKRFHINVPEDDQKKIKILQIALEITEDEVFLTAIRKLYKETILSGEVL